MTQFKRTERALDKILVEQPELIKKQKARITELEAEVERLHDAGMDATDDGLDWRERALEAEAEAERLREAVRAARSYLTQGNYRACGLCGCVGGHDEACLILMFDDALDSHSTE